MPLEWNRYRAVLFDLDGVLTPTALVHRKAWKRSFDSFLADRGSNQPFTDQDYLRFVDGKPRYDGVRDFLTSRGISLDDLESITKIPRRSLERLESGAFDEAPDGFARGFVRTVAGALGLDPDEAVMRLMSEPPAEEAGEPGAGSLPRRALFARAAVVGGAVLVAVGVYGMRIWWVMGGQYLQTFY